MTNSSAQMKLYLITDDSGRSVKDLTDRVSRGISGGATAVQFREKNCGPTLCSRSFEAISKVCESAAVPLFVNADLIGRFELNGIFEGYHYSDRTLPPNRTAGAASVGYSAHGPDDAVSAFSHGVTFCTLSPIFPTPSKMGILDAIGVDAIRISKQLLPDKTILALGGIDESNAEDCLRAGASGVAVIRAIMAASNPEQAAARLLRIVEKYCS